MKNKVLKIYFWSKNEKMFPLDLNSDLKVEPDWILGVALHYLNC